MERDYQNIQHIITRAILEQATEEELKELKAWYDADENNRKLYDETVSNGLIRKKMADYAEIDVSAAYKRNQHLLKGRTPYRYIHLFSYAAVAVIMLSVALLWQTPSVPEPAMPDIVASIPAGTKKAELILTNGEKVQLVAGLNTTLKEGNSKIQILGDKINYVGEKSPAAEAYNTIRTPLGGEYTITLDDGTVVWLNAKSELKYPIAFQGDKRVVKLKGEAYFDVKKMDGKPFIVEVEDYRVEVLGTTFNISSYTNQSCIYTTLCTGKVVVTDRRDTRQVNLVPGEQLACNVKTGEMAVRKIDVEMATAWIHGHFMFDNNTIEEIFTTLERWYGIQVFYANRMVRNETFTGKLPRFEELQTILNIMEEVSNIDFEVKGETIVVR